MLDPTLPNRAVDIPAPFLATTDTGRLLAALSDELQREWQAEADEARRTANPQLLRDLLVRIRKRILDGAAQGRRKILEEAASDRRYQRERIGRSADIHPH